MAEEVYTPAVYVCKQYPKLGFTLCGKHRYFTEGKFSPKTAEEEAAMDELLADPELMTPQVSTFVHKIDRKRGEAIVAQHRAQAVAGGMTSQAAHDATAHIKQLQAQESTLRTGADAETAAKAPAIGHIKLGLKQ